MRTNSECWSEIFNKRIVVASTIGCLLGLASDLLMERAWKSADWILPPIIASSISVLFPSIMSAYISFRERDSQEKAVKLIVKLAVWGFFTCAIAVGTGIGAEILVRLMMKRNTGRDIFESVALNLPATGTRLFLRTLGFFCCKSVEKGCDNPEQRERLVPIREPQEGEESGDTDTLSPHSGSGN